LPVEKIRCIICPIAFDADSDQEKFQYRNIGKNSKTRIEYAIKWVNRKYIDKPITWMFGAGTAKEYTNGPTLGQLGESYLLDRLGDEDVSNPDTIANLQDHKYYGTAEEIEWMVRNAHRRYSDDSVVFVFFTQPRHLWRVRLIVWLFQSHIKAHFVPTEGEDLVSWKDEIKSYVKIFMRICGLMKFRHE
jgi:hypothetical protein